MLRDKIVAWLAALVIAAGYFISSANADGPTKAGSILPEIPGVTTAKGGWTGGYVGVGGGYQVSDTEVSVPGISIIDGLSGRGWTGDARVGFDWQPSASMPLVFGILGGYNLGGVKTEAFNGVASATLDATWYVGGRIGVALPTNTLIYGGAAWQQAKGELGGVFSGSATDEGIMYIAGIEQKVAPHVTLGAEYSLSQYQFAAGPLAIEPDVHAFKVRLNFRTK
jgi:outer membrane immunogenic protein